MQLLIRIFISPVPQQRAWPTGITAGPCEAGVNGTALVPRASVCYLHLCIPVGGVVVEGARVVDGTGAPVTSGLGAATLVSSGVGGRTAGATAVEWPGTGSPQARRYASCLGVNGEAILCGRWMQNSGENSRGL